MPLVLAVPGLLLPPEAPDEMRALRLPRLERWLARAKRSRSAAGGHEQWLAHVAGMEGAPPIAAVTLAADRGAAAPGAWLRADPVHLRMGQESATLHEAASLAITPGEARALSDALTTHFAPDGLRFEAPVPGRWYLRIPDGDSPRTTPLDEAAGRDIRGRLPRTAGGRNRWLAILTEAQMVLSSHAVNLAREAAGQPAVNSIWLWGEGASPRTVALPFVRLHADDPFARGMALIAGIDSGPLVDDLGALAPCGRGENVLVLEHRAAEALRHGSIDEWIAAGRRFDAALEGLGEAIKRFGGVRLVLPGPRHALEAAIDSRWHWPRASPPLSSHA